LAVASRFMFNKGARELRAGPRIKSLDFGLILGRIRIKWRALPD